MPLNKLTQRARTVLQELSLKDVSDKKVEVDVTDVLANISNSEGLGAALLQNFPELQLDKNVLVELDLLIKEAYYQASSLEHTYVGTEHLLLALLKLTNSPDLVKIRNHLLSLNLFPRALNILSEKKDNIILNSYSVNLTKESLRNHTDPLIIREELDQLVSVLLKRDNANVLLVGELGVGKDSLIHLLVNSINSLEIPTLLAGYQVIEFDLMGYLTSVANKGNIDQSLLLLQEELRSLRRVILVLKNFQNLFISTHAGVGVPILLPIFKDLLENTNISFIATMNNSIYEKVILDNAHMLDTFTVVDVPEPDEATVLKMMQLKAKALGDFHNINISEKVIEYVYKIAKKYDMGMSFPQRGMDLLDLACAGLLVRKNRVPQDYKNLVDKTITYMEKVDRKISEGNYDQALKIQENINKIDKKLTAYENKMTFNTVLTLSQQDVEVALAEMDIDIVEKPSDTKYLSTLADKVKGKIIGQQFAVDTVVKALIRAELGLRSKKRPIGSFLFLGPTGVGKTELAKVLSQYAFGQNNKNHLIRLDMSDFSEKHTVARLIGSPPGYVGYNEGGELTSKIDLQPDSVVLFDEIEKAHPDVLNILLQITEEGELSDAKGTTFDFSKAIIVLTSNLGTEILHNKEIGFRENIKISDDKTVEKHLKENLKKILKPELLNRFDEVVVFRRLNKENQLEILELMLKDIAEKLNSQDVYLTVTKKAKEYLLKAGYSQEYGARSLRRTTEKELLDRVAEILLETHDRPLFLKTRVSKANLTVSIKN